MCECWVPRPERPNPTVGDYKDPRWYEEEAWSALYEERDGRREADALFDILKK